MPPRITRITRGRSGSSSVLMNLYSALLTGAHRSAFFTKLFEIPRPSGLVGARVAKTRTEGVLEECTHVRYRMQSPAAGARRRAGVPRARATEPVLAAPSKLASRLPTHISSARRLDSHTRTHFLLHSTELPPVFHSDPTHSTRAPKPNTRRSSAVSSK